MKYFPEIKLVGIQTKTSNALEANPLTAKIGSTISYYFKNEFAKSIVGRVKPGTTYCVYTEYESDEHGPYTYFIGEEVSSFSQISPRLAKCIIPAQFYKVCTFGPGKMPSLCIEAWKDIWKMSEEDFGGKRTYKADFEIYDEKAIDTSNATFDIYIGIRECRQLKTAEL